MEDFLKQYQPLKTLGRGKFAAVALCQSKASGKKFAAKHMVKTSSTAMNIAWEVKIFQLLQANPHPNIVMCYEIFNSETEVILVHEYLSNGDLLGYLDRQKYVLPEEEFAVLFLDILNAINHLHSLGIAHRDLKLENICLTADRRAKLIDFNLSCRWSPKDLIANQFCGSLNYCAPELFLGRPYFGPEVDCWAMGVLLFSMVFLRFPFEPATGSDPEDKHRSIALAAISGQFTYGSKLRADCSPQLKDLIGRMLIKDQDKRTRLVDLIDHPWLETARAAEKKASEQSEKSKMSDKIKDEGKHLSTSLKKKVLGDHGKQTSSKAIGAWWKVKQLVKFVTA